MGQNFGTDLAHGMKMEEEAVEYLRKKFPGAIVKRYTYEEDRELQKKGIDLVVSHRGRKFSVQVKSRKAGSQDLCFEGRWENGKWVMDWPAADYYLYFVPDFQEEPILIDVRLFAIQYDCNKADFKTTMWQNKEDRKSCAYIPPIQVVRESRGLHGWMRQSKIKGQARGYLQKNQHVLSRDCSIGFAKKTAKC
jgi:Holliday junction resolvase-like predicted endonuclease